MLYFPDSASIAAICFRAHHAAFRFGYEAVADGVSRPRPKMRSLRSLTRRGARPIAAHLSRIKRIGWMTTVRMTLLERGAINKSVMQPHNLSLHGNLMVRSVGRTRNRSDEGKRDAISITTAAPYLER